MGHINVVSYSRSAAIITNGLCMNSATYTFKLRIDCSYTRHTCTKRQIRLFVNFIVFDCAYIMSRLVRKAGVCCRTIISAQDVSIECRTIVGNCTRQISSVITEQLIKTKFRLRVRIPKT